MSRIKATQNILGREGGQGGREAGRNAPARTQPRSAAANKQCPILQDQRTGAGGEQLRRGSFERPCVRVVRGTATGLTSQASVSPFILYKGGGRSFNTSGRQAGGPSLTHVANRYGA